jgi:hypothetical protein
MTRGMVIEVEASKGHLSHLTIYMYAFSIFSIIFALVAGSEGNARDR